MLILYQVLEEAKKLGVSHLITAKYINEVEISCESQKVKYDPNLYYFTQVNVLPGTKEEDAEKIIEIRKKLNLNEYTEFKHKVGTGFPLPKLGDIKRISDG